MGAPMAADQRPGRPRLARAATGLGQPKPTGAKAGRLRQLVSKWVSNRDTLKQHLHDQEQFGTTPTAPINQGLGVDSPPSTTQPSGRNFTLRTAASLDSSSPDTPDSGADTPADYSLQYGTWRKPSSTRHRTPRLAHSSTALDLPPVSPDWTTPLLPDQTTPSPSTHPSRVPTEPHRSSVFDAYPRDDFTPFEEFTSDQSYRHLREAVHRRSIYDVVGYHDLLPALRQRLAFYIDTSRAGRYWDHFDVLVNLVLALIYIWNTQFVTKESANLSWSLHALDALVAAVLLVQYLPRYYLAVNRPRFLCTPLSLLTLVTTLPAILSFFWAQVDEAVDKSFMSAGILGYAFPIRFIRLQLAVFGCLVPVKNGLFAVSTITRKACRLAFGILLTLLTVSSLVHLVTYNQMKPTDPLLDFGEAFFFTTVSSTSGLSTNLVPDTTFSRLVILYIMVVGAVFIPTNLSELLTLMSRKSKYPTSFTPESHQSHVLLVGTLESVALGEFLREFFCEDHGPITINTVVVILGTAEPSEDVANILTDPAFVNRVKYVRGSPTSFRSLQKVCAYQAKACFLLTTKGAETQDPILEDATSVMYALAIKKYSRSANTKLKLYTQVLVPQTEAHLEYLATRTICIDELRLGLLAQTAVIPGFASLLQLLTTSITDATCDQILKSLRGRPRMSWIKEYVRGATQEIYPVTFSPFWIGHTFSQVAEVIYTHFGATLFALRIRVSVRRSAACSHADEPPSSASHCRKWQLVMNPVHHVLCGNEMGFVIATTSDIAQAISNFGEGYAEGALIAKPPGTMVPPEYQPWLFGTHDSHAITMPMDTTTASKAAPHPTSNNAVASFLTQPSQPNAEQTRAIPTSKAPRASTTGTDSLSPPEPISPAVGKRKTDLVFMGPSEDEEEEEDDGVEIILPSDLKRKSEPGATPQAETPAETSHASPSLSRKSTDLAGVSAEPARRRGSASTTALDEVSQTTPMPDKVARTPGEDQESTSLGTEPNAPISQTTKNVILEKNVERAQAAAWAEMDDDERDQALATAATQDQLPVIKERPDTPTGNRNVETNRASPETSSASPSDRASGKAQPSTGSTPTYNPVEVPSSSSSSSSSPQTKDSAHKADKKPGLFKSVAWHFQPNSGKAPAHSTPPPPAAPKVKDAKPAPADHGLRRQTTESAAEAPAVTTDSFYNVPKGLSEHLVLCDTGSQFPANLEYFIGCLRAPYRQRALSGAEQASESNTSSSNASESPSRARTARADLPIVILSPHEPEPSLKRLLQRFGQVYMVQGSPLVRKDLFRAQIHCAEKAVVLSGAGNNAYSTSRHTDDSAALLAVLNIESLALDDDFFVVVEFIHRENMKFVGESETVPIDELYAQAILRPSFMSGHVFAPCMLDTLICQTYYNNHLLDIIKQFIFSHRVSDRKVDIYASQRTSPKRHHRSHKSPEPAPLSAMATAVATPREELPSAGHTTSSHYPACDPLLDSSPDGSSSSEGDDDTNEPDQMAYYGHTFLVPIPSHFVGGLYSALFSHLCRNHQAVALGLYRSVTHKQSPLWYVLCNPGPAMTLRRGDRVYVLSNREPQL